MAHAGTINVSIHAPRVGSDAVPQGGVISPLLSNLYHFAFLQHS